MASSASTRSWCPVPRWARSRSEGQGAASGVRLPADPSDAGPGGPFAGQEIGHERVEAVRALDHRYVAGVLEDHLARVRADQLFVALGVLDRHEDVVAPPHEQDRDLDPRQPAADRVADQRVQGGEEPLAAAAVDELPGQWPGELLR